MNDEFLHRLRRRPPARFKAALQARLDMHGHAPVKSRPAWLRPLGFGVLIGGAAVAATLLAMRGMPESLVRMFQAAPPDAVAPQVPQPPLPQSVPEEVRVENQRNRIVAALPPSEAAPSGEVQNALVATATPMTAPMSQSTSVGSSNGMMSGGAPGLYGTAQLSIAGSMNTYAIAKAVGEMSQQITNLATIVSRDVADGMRAFCAGAKRANMAIVSTRMTAADLQTCHGNGVDRITELKLGHQAIVLAGAKIGTFPKLSRRDLYLALARRVPDPANPLALIDNPYRTWNQINPELEPGRIEIFGPPPQSPLRDPLAERVMETGCNTYPWIKALKVSDVQRYEDICHAIRTDGVYIDAQETDRLVTQVLWSSPGSLGLLGYNFYSKRQEQFNGSLLEGADATAENIDSGAYLGARTLYVYVNGDSVRRVADFNQFLRELTSEWSIGPRGTLTRLGLTPLTDVERDAQRIDAAQSFGYRF